MNQELVRAIGRVAREIPESDLEKVTRLLMQSAGLPLSTLRSQVASLIPSSTFRKRISEVMELAAMAEVPAESIALALESAVYADRERDRRLGVELVWTGPATPELPVRKLDQVLLHLINTAKSEIWLITYAAYRFPHVVSALRAAIDRGILVSMLLETKKESQGKLGSDSLDTIREELPAARIFVWPRERRPDHKEMIAVLHAKSAIIDREKVLISSANLTGAAMDLNVELGVQVRSKETAQRLVRHLEFLIERGVFMIG